MHTAQLHNSSTYHP